MSSTQHTIQSGDTLASLAALAYGDTSQFRKLAEANGLDVLAPLVAGTSIEIPSAVTPPFAGSAPSSDPYGGLVKVVEWLI